MKDNFNEEYLKVLNTSQDKTINETASLIYQSGKWLYKGARAAGKKISKNQKNRKQLEREKTNKKQQYILDVKTKKIKKDTLTELANNSELQNEILSIITSKFSEFKDQFSIGFSLIKDYVNKKYTDIEYESIIDLGTLLYSVHKFKENSLSSVIKEELDFLKEDIEDYQNWKNKNSKKEKSVQKNKETAKVEEKPENKNISAESKEKTQELIKLLLSEEGSKFCKHYFSIIYEEAKTSEKKLETIEKIDPNVAKDLKNAEKNGENTKLDKEEVKKVEETLDKDDKTLDQKRAETKQKLESGEISKNETLKKAIDSKDDAKKLMNIILSSDLLTSLIPFEDYGSGRIPIIGDIDSFFDAIAAALTR